MTKIEELETRIEELETEFQKILENPKKISQVNPDLKYKNKKGGRGPFAAWYLKKFHKRFYDITTIRSYANEHHGFKIVPENINEVMERPGTWRYYTRESLDRDVAANFAPLAERIAEQKKTKVDE